MLCEWLNGRFEIYFAVYFFLRQATLPFTIEYIRAVKYGFAILQDGSNLEETPFQIRPKEDMSLHSSCMAANSSPAMLNVQHEVNVELTKIYVAEYLPSLLVIFLLGVRTDDNGRRRTLLVAPLIGLTAFWLGFVLDFSLQPGTLSYVYAGAVVSGLTGGDGAVRVAMTTFVSDSSPIEQRTKRMIIMEILRQTAATMASLLITSWIQSEGFEPCMWICFALSVLLVKLVIHIMDESNPLDREFRSGSFNAFLRACSFRNIRSITHRIYLMVLVGYGCFALVEGGFYLVVLAVAERTPICMKPLLGWQHNGIMQAVSVAGLMLATMLTRFLNDYKIGLIGVTSALAGGIFMGLSKQSGTWPTVIVAALLFFTAVPYPVFLAIASKHTEPQKRGVAFAFMSLSETTAVLLAFIVYPPLVETSFAFINAPVFIVGALFLLIPFIIFGLFQLTSAAKRSVVDVFGAEEGGSDVDSKDHLNQGYNSESS